MFIGLIIAILPFLLLFRYEDKKSALVNIIGIVSLFHFLVAVTTQYFGIMTYNVVLTAHGILGLICLIKLFSTKRYHYNFHKITPHLSIIIVLLIVATRLLFLHLDYSGEVVTVTGLKKVENSSYTYPLYSDEWITASLANYSIETGGLPMVNTLDNNSAFLNLLAGFHSLIAEVALLFSIDPISEFYILATVCGLLIVFSLYLLLRSYGVDPWVGSIAVALLVFFTNSGNMPGILYLLPFSLSLIFYLLCLVALARKAQFGVFVFSLLALAVYPPIFILLIPTLIPFMLSTKKNLIYSLSVFGVALVAVLLIAGSTFLGERVVEVAMDFLVRENLDGAIPNYNPFHLIPFFIFPFSIFGIYKVFQNKYYEIIIPTLIGVVYWVVYMFWVKVFIIEHPRIILLCMILATFLFGYGFSVFANEYLKKEFWPRSSLGKYTVFSIFLCFFLFLAYLFPGNSAWKKITITVDTPQGEKKFMPDPPINRYLHPDDLKLFEGIKGSHFISIPWKGLVVGVATENFPVHSKSSLVANKKIDYYQFLALDCKKKKETAQREKIDYLYSTEVTCPGLTEVGRSADGLILYKF